MSGTIQNISSAGRTAVSSGLDSHSAVYIDGVGTISTKTDGNCFGKTGAGDKTQSTQGIIAKAAV